MNNLIFLFITVGICLIVFILLLLYQALRLRNRNRVMADTIGRLMHYRHIVIQNGDKEEIEEEKQDITKEEYQLFKDIDKRIMKERLFADPNFGRDELMRLFGVDKNTLPSIIQRYTHHNVPGYINTKRMEYAVYLIKNHPEYTLGAIAEACGIKSPATFIRNFKNVYGMTPSEYRSARKDILLPPPVPINT